MDKNKSFNIDDLITSGKILASSLYLSKEITKPNTTPLEIDLEIEKFILSNNAYPSFKGLSGYPYSTCISINNQVVHGIPTKIPLNAYDIITIDIGVSYNGHCTDAARTFIVGGTTNNNRIKHMINTAYTALDSGISKACTGNTVGDISYEIQKHIFKGKYSTSLEYGGHGIGLKPHMEPFIPNYGVKNTGLKLKSGMCLAIEPIVIDGSNELLENKYDGWTVYSPYGYLSAHVEDTVIVLDTPIIVTRETLNGNLI